MGGGGKGGGGVKAYKIHLGQVFVLANSPLESVLKIFADEKEAFAGNITANQRIYINAPNLFGGEESEGGVEGFVDFAFGGAEQAVNDYISSHCEYAPAYRSVVTAIFRDVYVGLNPYIKPFAFLAKRIRKTDFAQKQWYEATSAIPAENSYSVSKMLIAEYATCDNAKSPVQNRDTGFTPITQDIINNAEEDWFRTQIYYAFGSSTGVSDFLKCEKNRADWMDINQIFCGENGILTRVFYTEFTSQFSFKTTHEDVCWENFPYFSYLEPHIIELVNKHQGIRTTTRPTAEQYLIFDESEGKWCGVDVDFVVRYPDFDCDRETIENIAVKIKQEAIKLDETLHSRLTPCAMPCCVSNKQPLFSPRYTPNDAILVRLTSPIKQSVFLHIDLDIMEKEEGFAHVFVTKYNKNGELLSHDKKQNFWDYKVGKYLNYVNVNVSFEAGDYVEFFRLRGGSYYYYPSNKALRSLNNECGFSVSIRDNELQAVEDMNPAHIIRECLVSPVWGLGVAEDLLDDESFVNCAYTLYNEKFGLSLKYTQSGEIKDFISDILTTIDAVLYISRKTGKYVLKLVRDDYDIDTLPTLDNDVIVEIEDFAKPQKTELINYVTIKYTQPQTLVDCALSAQNDELINLTGRVNSIEKSYNGISNDRVALMLATRDLRAQSSSFVSCTITTQRGGIVEELNIGDCFKLRIPFYDNLVRVMRITEIDWGTLDNNKCKITCAEDIFTTESPTYTAQGGIISEETTIETPPPLIASVPYYQMAMYYGDEEAQKIITEYGARLGIATARPSQNALFARCYLNNSQLANVNFVTCAKINAIDNKTTEIMLTGDNLVAISVGDVLQIGNEERDPNSVGLLHFRNGEELIECVQVEAVWGNKITVKRGVNDTIPTRHAENTIIYNLSNATLCDTGTLIEEECNVVLQPVNNGTPKLSNIEASATLSNRASRPYNVANIQINGLNIYDDIVITNKKIDVMWAWRYNLLQTTDSCLSFFNNLEIKPFSTSTIKLYLLIEKAPQAYYLRERDGVEWWDFSEAIYKAEINQDLSNFNIEDITTIENWKEEYATSEMWFCFMTIDTENNNMCFEPCWIKTQFNINLENEEENTENTGG